METNVQVKSYFFGNERGRIFISITFEYKGFTQAFGPYQLENYDADNDEFYAHPKSLEFIQKILDAFGVSELNRIVGKFARIKIEDGLITKITHIVEDEYYVDPLEIFN